MELRQRFTWEDARSPVVGPGRGRRWSSVTARRSPRGCGPATPTPALALLPAYIHEAVVRAYIQRASHRGLPAAALDELVAPWTTEAGRRAFYRQTADFDERFLVEIEQHLDQLSCPARVVRGVDDAWIPMEHGRRLAGLIDDAELGEVPDAGHLIQHDAPVALTDLVRTWRDRQAGRTDS